MRAGRPADTAAATGYGATVVVGEWTVPPPLGSGGGTLVLMGPASAGHCHGLVQEIVGVDGEPLDRKPKTVDAPAPKVRL
jgi:hypothetical protein